ncbi:hypothetical protein A9Q94_00460 [Rhodobacterales bacterium 56_14_T64]|nr:hypothetical protein A9Q94_00460 [Rhodobacterales bacterium 56_14_T64]
MQGILYFHVPKCGGSSFGAALRLRFFYSQASVSPRDTPQAHCKKANPTNTSAQISARYETRHLRLTHLLTQGTRCITGHMRYCPDLHDRLATAYAHVTLLRDPVTRFVSHYRYLQRHHPDPNRAKTLDAFLDSPDAERIGSQFLFYFGGATSDQDQAITRANLALSQFDLVGDLGNPAGFLTSLRQLVPGPLLHLHRNRAPPVHPIPEALQARIEQICAADIAIYRAAMALPQAA